VIKGDDESATACGKEAKRELHESMEQEEAAKRERERSEANEASINFAISLSLLSHLLREGEGGPRTRKTLSNFLNFYFVSRRKPLPMMRGIL
jgi:hypothetical protein